MERERMRGGRVTWCMGSEETENKKNIFPCSKQVSLLVVKDQIYYSYFQKFIT
jgi:hypothetical protein